MSTTKSKEFPLRASAFITPDDINDAMIENIGCYLEKEIEAIYKNGIPDDEKEPEKAAE